ncbi:helix-turn-helix domain-containing protein [Paenibacillus alkalitolerans]|uniref:helix-turn-helix domain-containing protein n=1 Tax=Paenibacillus alkalitolerans TaxID=2799335 RepID=UPI0018F27AF9|nr:helix-turn-helix transcriptional regulator [Paenibacillus alkalitolerans]
MLRLKLDQLMVEKRVNTRQLSEMTGIRWNTIDDMAKNKAKHWSPENLEKIMKALDLEDIGELIEYKKEQKG